MVTGAGQGIGRATARRLGQEGGTVVVADRIDAAATGALAELRNHGVEAMKAIVDLGTLAGAQRDCRRANPRMSQFLAISGFFFLDTE